MSDNSPPPDNSQYLQYQQEQDAKQAKIDADAKAAKDAADLAALRTSTRGNANNTVAQYFTSRGIDPAAYGSDIDTQLNNILNGIAPNDPNPGSYYANAPQDIYNSIQSSQESKANAALDALFNPTYSSDKINQSLVDPITGKIYNDQRAQADAIVQNMIKRGVLTASGGNAAEADLDRQAAGVRSKLQGFGSDVVAGGQQSLDDIINSAHQTASGLHLGQAFDPNTYVGKASDTFDRFINSLGDSVNAKVGNSNLFQTNGLAAIGGAAQGAGNTKYDPLAAAGIISDDQNQPKPNNNTTTENIF
jgi:hypothetical protein